MEAVAILLEEVAATRARVAGRAWAYQAKQVLDDVEYWLKQAGEDGGTRVDPEQFREAIAEAERTATEGPEPRRVLGRVPYETLLA